MRSPLPDQLTTRRSSVVHTPRGLISDPQRRQPILRPSPCSFPSSSLGEFEPLGSVVIPRNRDSPRTPLGSRDDRCSRPSPGTRAPLLLPSPRTRLPRPPRNRVHEAISSRVDLLVTPVRDRSREVPTTCLGAGECWHLSVQAEGRYAGTVCGRFLLHDPPRRYAAVFQAQLGDDLEDRFRPSWNVPPACQILGAVEQRWHQGPRPLPVGCDPVSDGGRVQGQEHLQRSRGACSHGTHLPGTMQAPAPPDPRRRMSRVVWPGSERAAASLRAYRRGADRLRGALGPLAESGARRRWRRLGAIVHHHHDRGGRCTSANQCPAMQGSGEYVA